MGIIYKATNKMNGKIYIGQTMKSIKERRLDHLRSRSTKKYYFHNALSKYGYKNFIWEEIDFANNREELNEKEIFWIKYFDSTDKDFGYNCTKGGRVPIFNEETRKKISKAGKGRKHSPETIKKLKEIHKGKKIRPDNYVYTEEHKRKMSEANKGRGKGRKLSQETRKKMSESRKGKVAYICTDETRKKMSEVNKGRVPWNKGLKNCYSEETLKKMSESSKKYKPTEETKQKISQSLKGRPSPTKEKPMHPNTKKALLKSITGRECKPDTKKKIGDAQKGEKNHRYGKKDSKETLLKKSISIRNAVERKKRLGIPWQQKESNYMRDKNHESKTTNTR